MKGTGDIKMREKWIDAVKAIAILFVLLGHARVRIPYVSNLAVLFYVPVFFVLAGYLHHHRPEESYSGYVGKRAKRLLLPYFGYNAFLLLFSIGKGAAEGRLSGAGVLRSLLGIIYGVNTVWAPESLESVYKPLFNIWNAPMWFLPALFLSEILFEGMIRLLRENRTAVLWSCIWCAVFGTVVEYLSPVLLPWSIGTVLLTEVLVVTGSELRRYHLVERIGEKLWVIVMLFLAAGILRRQNGAVNISIGIWGQSIAVGLFAVLLASAGIMALMWRMEKRLPQRLAEGLSVIGRNTMPVLCLHLFVFMFVQAVIQLFLPDFPDGRGVLYEAARVGMVLVTMDVIVIGKLWFTPLFCRKRHGKKGE